MDTENGETMWSVTLSPIIAGGPFGVQVDIGAASLILQDVLFGDVWICSGQSNMEFHVQQVSKDTGNISSRKSL